MSVEYLTRENKPTLAFVHTQATENASNAPIVMFFGGYRSDMEGTKAVFLENMCAARGQDYVRFDYSGHGLSDGAFADATIGDWMEDALSIFDHIVAGRQAILVGSSMGGWIALLVARARAPQIQGVVGIAAAPDFTEVIYNALSETQKTTLMEKGVVGVENDYSDEPYHYSKAFYEEAKSHLLLTQNTDIPYPLRLVQGKNDIDVPWQTAVKINDALSHNDSEIILIDDGNHRLSRPNDMQIIDAQIKALFDL
jgi:esterase/lipase